MRKSRQILTAGLVGAAGVLGWWGVVSAQAPPAGLPTRQQVIAYLNQSIEWQRQVALEEQAANGLAAELFVGDDRENATQLLRLSFDFARADAQLLGTQGSAEGRPEAAAPSQYQGLAHAAAAADSELQQTQTELDSDKAAMQASRGNARVKLKSEIDELTSEVGLARTRSQTLHDLLQFVSGAGGEGGSLSAQIEQLQRSVPELQAQALGARSTAAGGPPGGTGIRQAENGRSQYSGIVGLVEDLFSLSRQIRLIDRRVQATAALATASHGLRAPLLTSLTAIAQQGEQAAQQADTSDPAQLEQLKSKISRLNASFKQLSPVVLPLSKQDVLFALYESNLARWRSLVQSDYSAALKRLLLRLILFAIVLGIVIGLARMWRRAVFRYVHDPRRRYQFLLLRRIVLWCAIGITVAFALASEIGSIATFAGLITAGLAVALQNLILAIAGYFFLIGKYGIRVGDRVQISGVTGDVIDVGLIRLRLMEVGGAGTNRQPTGRVVVFSNAVVFQPNAGLYKQIPGTHFTWHEVSLTLAPGSDYGMAEKRVLGAVEKIYSDYREKITRQHEAMQRTLSVAVELPEPRSQLRLRQSGLEVVVYYPVEIDTASDIDDRVTRELLHALEQPPRLKLVGTGLPNI